MSFAAAGEWVQWEPDGPCLVVSCNTCRGMTFTDDPGQATDLMLAHTRQCSGADTLIVELIVAV